MDWKAFEDGKAGRPMADGADLMSYTKGADERRQLNAGPKVEVPGVAFTLIIVAPLIWVVYPVVGGALLAGFYGVVVGLGGGYDHAGVGVIALGVVAALVGFFYGLRLEARISQFAPYRWIRMVMRWIGAGVVVFAFAASPDMNPAHIDINRAPPSTLAIAIVVAVLMHFVFRTMDRLYFPVWTHVRENAAIQAAGDGSLPRPMARRIINTLLWLFPVWGITNLLIRLVVDQMTDGVAGRKAFYAHYEPLVYAADLVIWLGLCFFGILPGTHRRAKSFIDHEILLASRGEEPKR